MSLLPTVYLIYVNGKIQKSGTVVFLLEHEVTC